MEEKYDLVLLLGGTGSRMKNKPQGNKHLVEINGKTNIEHIKQKIDTYEKTNKPFENKYVITNSKGVEEIMHILGQNYTYFYQENPTGIPDAAFLPKPLNPFLLHLGDQFYTDNINDLIEGFYSSNEAMRIWIKNTDDTNHTVALTEDNNLKRFVEKPNYGHGIKGKVVTGMYMLKPYLYGLVDKLPRHEKNENNMSDLGNNIIYADGVIGAREMKGEWADVNSQEFKNVAELYLK